MKIVTDERCTEFSAYGHPERPARITRSLQLLRSQIELPLRWAAPRPVEESVLLRAHTPEYLARLKKNADDFDSDTPAYKDIFVHACRAVGGALEALDTALKGNSSFSLLRPPGHHATPARAMGFCYLSTVAITVLEAIARGTERVAVFDFDVHHGNGTEAVLLNKPNVAFYSIHQYPCYPGTGTQNVGKNCFNYPVLPQTPADEYRKVLGKALEDLLQFKPKLIAVSAGFDAYERDPIAQEMLDVEDFHWLGQGLRKTGIPFFSVLEGGYSDDLPDLILAYLRGVEGK